MAEQQLTLLPPAYCEYASGPCDQDFGTAMRSEVLFLFASHPMTISATIRSARDVLADRDSSRSWKTWEDLPIPGRIVFCEVCKAARFTTTVVIDVTTLNFNMLFEVGFCVGLGVPIIPVRDASYNVDAKAFEALAALDTLGHTRFTNARELASAIGSALPTASPPRPPTRDYPESPLYVVKAPVSTDGQLSLMSILKKSRLRFRAYDPDETPRLSLNKAHREVSGSVGVVAHLMSTNRVGAVSHNALCALIGGIALAEGKSLLLLQEEAIEQPIDYRDIVRPYDSAANIQKLVEPFIDSVVSNMQGSGKTRSTTASGLLERVDFGDVAAENEIAGLQDYFVRTGQFAQALQGHARLVVGRKGTGKTAIFYGVRDAVPRGYSTLVLDLKPEGHQFTKLRESVLEKMTLGVREHTLTGFWRYMLLCEIAHKVLETEYAFAQRDPTRRALYEAVSEAYLDHRLGSADDLSQRMLRQVERLINRFDDLGGRDPREHLTELIYGRDVAALESAVAKYLAERDAVWILVDNLDKGWSHSTVSEVDILVLRSLLAASRKLQQELEELDVELKSLIFVRTDIYDHLLRQTPDKGKDTPISLDWDDPDVFRAIVGRRIEATSQLSGSFDEVWRALFVSHVQAEDSFSYLVDRTLMRPRDLLSFVQRCVEVAVNRGHGIVGAEDIYKAEESYSEDMLLATMFEMEDTHPELADVLYAFEDATPTIEQEDLLERLANTGLAAESISDVVEVLVWFGFLGVRSKDDGREQYSYDVRYNVRRLLGRVDRGSARFVVHPAFRAALGIAP
jgi:hypothetical protein